MKKVIYIVGQPYCGATFLGMLLDRYRPLVRMLGEGRRHLFAQGGKSLFGCTVCRDKECSFFGSYAAGAPIYQHCFDRYNGCEVLVDCGHQEHELFEQITHEPNYDYRVVHLTRAPHAHAYSYWRHHRPGGLPRNSVVSRTVPEPYGTVAGCLHSYFRLTDKTIYRLTVSGVTHCRIKLADVANHTKTALEVIGRECGVEFEREAAGASDSHVFGGNPGVLYQLTGDAAFAFGGPVEEYLDNKYAGRTGDPFDDTAWQRDPKFLPEFLPALVGHGDEYRPLLAKFGYNYATVLAEVYGALHSIIDNK